MQWTIFRCRVCGKSIAIYGFRASQSFGIDATRKWHRHCNPPLYEGEHARCDFILTSKDYLRDDVVDKLVCVTYHKKLEDGQFSESTSWNYVNIEDLEDFCKDKLVETDLSQLLQEVKVDGT